MKMKRYGAMVRETSLQQRKILSIWCYLKNAELPVYVQNKKTIFSQFYNASLFLYFNVAMSSVIVTV